MPFLKATGLKLFFPMQCLLIAKNSFQRTKKPWRNWIRFVGWSQVRSKLFRKTNQLLLSKKKLMMVSKLFICFSQNILKSQKKKKKNLQIEMKIKVTKCFWILSIEFSILLLENEKCPDKNFMKVIHWISQVFWTGRFKLFWQLLSFFLHFSAVEEVKGPGDYPMPPSPESNTPSDDSNEEKSKY